MLDLSHLRISDKSKIYQSEQKPCFGKTGHELRSYKKDALEIMNMATKMDRVEVGYKLAKKFKDGECRQASYSTGGKSGFVFFTDKSV